MVSAIEAPHIVSRPETYKKGDIIIRHDDIVSRLNALAGLIAEKYRDKKLLVVGVEKGAIPTMRIVTEELRRLGLNDIEEDTIRVRSYAEAGVSGPLTILKDSRINAKGRHVLVVEDIVDTGNTLKRLDDLFIERGCASLESLATCDKRERRHHELKGFSADYVGFVIPDIWVMGFGMDSYDNDAEREIPDIVAGKDSEPLISLAV